MPNWESYSKKTTSDLIELISWKGEGDEETEEVANLAFVAFYERFKVDLTRKCEILCKNHKQDSSVALEILEETVQSFLKSKTFKCDKEDLVEYDKSVLFYMFSIAYRKLIDYYRKINGLRGTKYTGEEELVYDIEELGIFQNRMKTKKELASIKEVLTHALNELNDNQKLIYLSYFNAKVNEGEKPPRHLALLIREATGLKQNSVRSELFRARQLVKATTKVYVKRNKNKY